MNKLNQRTDYYLIGVDVQNDFTHGSLAVPDGESVVEPLRLTADAVRKLGGTVTWTRDWHPATTPHFDKWPIHCVAGTEGVKLHPDLGVQPKDFILSKGMEQTDGYSGWEGVDLSSGATMKSILDVRRRRSKQMIIVGGIATDYCVQATALDIARAFPAETDRKLLLLRDSIRAINITEGDEARALASMHQAGFIDTTSQKLIRQIRRN